MLLATRERSQYIAFNSLKRSTSGGFQLVHLSMHHTKTINNKLSVLSALHTLVVTCIFMYFQAPCRGESDKNTSALVPCDCVGLQPNIQTSIVTERARENSCRYVWHQVYEDAPFRLQFHLLGRCY